VTKLTLADSLGAAVPYFFLPGGVWHTFVPLAWWQDLLLDFHSMKRQLLRPIMDNEISACIIAQNRKTKGIIGRALWSLIDSQYVHITMLALNLTILQNWIISGCENCHHLMKDLLDT
jgi:hypothetical protein